MKYAIVIPDGCADEPQDALGGKTPLEAARLDAMDRVAAGGQVGLSCNTPRHLPAGSDVANMSLLGYDPNQHFTGRAPLEAAAQGLALGERDWAVRCNLVTIRDQVMRDFTADHITTAEARELLAAVQSHLNADHLEFVPGVSYRNLLLWRGDRKPAPFSRDTRTTPPHDLTDQTVADGFPRGPGSAELSELMEASVALFASHPANQTRLAAGRLPATNIWLWGLGQAPQLPRFEQLHGIRGCMITAVDLLRGLAALIGWERVEAPGATGYTDTDYASKGRTAIAALDHADLVCVHIEAPDEASHEGDLAAKIKALEEIDRHIVAPLHEALAARGDYRLLISPDHPTPLRTKTHSHGHVPFAMAGAGLAPDSQTEYHEAAATASALRLDNGWELMSRFVCQQ